MAEFQTNLAWDALLELGEGRDGPLHARLSVALREAIRDGRLPAGSALPPSRTWPGPGLLALGRHRDLRPAGAEGYLERPGRLRHPGPALGRSTGRSRRRGAGLDAADRPGARPARPARVPGRSLGLGAPLGHQHPALYRARLPGPGRSSPAAAGAGRVPGPGPGRPGRPGAGDDLPRGHRRDAPDRPGPACGRPRRVAVEDRAGTGCARPPSPPGCGSCPSRSTARGCGSATSRTILTCGR